ncbi:hypothetical protein Egran_05535 [Elaphomyces granulatus]|uniref:O-methyltransferase C-terminal domain-containing protein n=1 Tax=Elaphomyces granulatus TaxID=519963 RepID=A0A232LRB1_9EURO|nr:hypothetical protein Egran_05535 [Elaphomyces granulatus]
MAEKVPSLKDLAISISENATIIEDFLVANDRPHLSFAATGDQMLPMGPEFEHVQDARITLIGKAKLLLDLALGPIDGVKNLSFSNLHDLGALSVIYRYNIPSLVALEGETPIGEISKATGLSERRLLTVLRQLMLHHVFYEPRENCVAHTARSALLVRDPNAMDWLGHIAVECLPPTAKLSEALEVFGSTDKDNEAAFNLTFNTKENCIQYISSHPLSAKRFGGALAFLGDGDAVSYEGIVQIYPWGQLGVSKIVDVGGGRGRLSFALAEKYSDLTFVVQDQPEMGKHIEYPPHLMDRVSFEVHDFFTPQPIVAEVYLLGAVLHDWPDNKAIEIIQNLVAAMKDGARIILAENVKMQSGSQPYFFEAIIRAMDMQMLTMFNSQERTLADWKALMQKADHRLEFCRVVSPPGHFSALEFVFHT